MKSKHLRTTDLDDFFPLRPNVILGPFCDKATDFVSLLKLSLQFICFPETLLILNLSD